MSHEDTVGVQELIARFANSFDVKDWEALRGCLAQSVYTDYSDLRGTPPVAVTSQEYVRSRRESLEDVITHHLAGNYEIEYQGDHAATCRASMIIWRKAGEEQFTTHCVYLFRLEKPASDWQISGITQKVLWNEGNPDIHPGAR